MFNYTRNKIPSIILHHEVTSYAMNNCFSEYMSYIDLLFVSNQVYDVDSYEFSIRDDKGNKIVDDASIIQILNMHEVKKEGKKSTFMLIMILIPLYYKWKCLSVVNQIHDNIFFRWRW